MAFLCDRQMWLAIDGKCSAKACVVSDVPQGTVHGPLLFLLFINDLLSQVSPGTITRLFSDDCLIYREIASDEDQVIFQRDLSALDDPTKRWGMRFNPSKCNIVIIHRPQSLFSKSYELSSVTLEEVEHAKYLGITLSNKLEWGQHVDNVTKKASNTQLRET